MNIADIRLVPIDRVTFSESPTEKGRLGLSVNPNTIKSYKNYLQNTQHMVLRNRPTLIIGTERLACLNSPHGVQRGTLA